MSENAFLKDPEYYQRDIDPIILLGFFRKRTKENPEISYNGEACWEWSLSLVDGYGVIYDRESRNNLRVHRCTYECANGKIDKGLVIRHLCHNKKCCNPSHLTSGTNLDNYWDSREKYLEAIAKPLVIDENEYESIAAASRATNIDPKLLRKFSTDGVFNRGLYSVRNLEPGLSKIAICIRGTAYESISEAVKKTGLTWREISLFTKDHVFDHVSYDLYRSSRRKRWSGHWIVDGVLYDSIISASRGSGINRCHLSIYSNEGIFDRAKYETRLKRNRRI